MVEVGLAATFLAKSEIILRAYALCTGTVAELQKYDKLSLVQNQHDCGQKTDKPCRCGVCLRVFPKSCE